ncbi:right-handed parallel beta-helix repeat-containing protein [Mariniphaga sediminis]|uniref:right-handed parallel beta-helix repeat-containing protein n=1 Tax=Mariniphaga sediminis TaxID=1628158 RepID=UPI003569473D
MKKIRILLLLLVVVTLVSCANKKTVFVSTQGSDQGDGTREKPFLTLEKARDFIREKRVKNGPVPYSILVREGEYYFTRPLTLTEEDNGVTIAAYNNEKVRFTGGLSIDPDEVLRVSGTSKRKLFPEENREDIFLIHLKDIGITAYGNLHPVGFKRPEKSVWMELFINGEPFHLSRWPNDSSVAIGKIINRGSVAAEGDEGDTGGTFTYSVTRPSSWKNPEDIWIAGYFRYGWADDAVKLASIDTINQTFTTTLPHRYGFGTGKPYNRWYAYNIPEEIDAPGEYYIDRTEGIVYFYNPGKIETIEVSVFEDLFISITGASNITVKGIDFECTRGVAVEMISTKECLLTDCSFKNIGRYAVTVDYEDIPLSAGKNPVLSKNNGIVNCTVCQTGTGGIKLNGGNRNTLESAGNYVENSVIHDFNRIAKTYCAGIRISGVGNRISNNEIFNSPHSAILLHGNDHLIEYNEIHNVCLVTDDVGAVYYGRNPSFRGNVVRFNYFHHLGDVYRTTAVYHDDGACAMEVHGNIFYKAGTIPVLIGGGSDNVYTNNIFIDTPIGIKVDNRMQAFEWAKPMIAAGGVIEQRLAAVKYNQPPYSERYPELAKYWDEDPSLPKRNLIDKNVFVQVDQIIKRVDEGVNTDKKLLEFTDNNYITNEDPGFVDKENQNFKLKDTSVIFKKIPGFKQIPVEKIGPL